MSNLSKMKFMRGSTAIETHEENKKLKQQHQQHQQNVKNTTKNTENPQLNSNSGYNKDHHGDQTPQSDDQVKYIQLNSSSSKDSAKLYKEQLGKDLNSTENSMTADQRNEEYRKVGASRRTFGGFKSNQSNK
jgi:hypothetical protein